MQMCLSKESMASPWTVCLVPYKGCALQMCLSKDAVAHFPEQARQRHCRYSQVQPPLAVSGPRGVCCTLTSTQQAVLYDLEEDPSEEDSDEVKSEQGLDEDSDAESSQDSGEEAGAAMSDDDYSSPEH